MRHWMILGFCLLIWVGTMVSCSNVECVQDSSCAKGQTCQDSKCVCPEGQLRCQTLCLDGKTDRNNCGECGKVCPESRVCRDGKCDCEEGSLLCGKTCARVLNDPKNCGKCGVKCSKEEACLRGSCVKVCTSPQAACGERCVDLKRDTEHCGACGNSCGFEQICRNGKCTCPPGLDRCGEGKKAVCALLEANNDHCDGCGKSCKSGQKCSFSICVVDCPKLTPDPCRGGCVDFKINRYHCGACGNYCKGGRFCRGGKCVCPPGMLSCGEDGCIDPRNSRTHCGDCEVGCASGQFCVDGQCLASCPKRTPGKCEGGCYDFKQNPNHCGGCGKACKRGQVCEDGKCKCPGKQVLCRDRCVDVSTFRNHCGGCEVKCPAGEVCSGGKCSQSCPNGKTDCGFSCVDLKTSDIHCGRCFGTCRGGKQCISGNCACPDQTTDCKGACANLDTDPLNCGGCGQRCEPNEACIEGKCIYRCPEGQDLCGAACADLKTDNQNCGTCGNKCVDGRKCKNGICEKNCALSEPLCGGVCCDKFLFDCCDNKCVDKKNNPNHCGACNKKCGAGRPCVNGLCCTGGRSEICNNRDDDCDGKVDNNVIDGKTCANQRGFCAGARATQSCVNGNPSTKCTEADYKAHYSSYESTEKSCDGQDNDCDGQEDEGVPACDRAWIGVGGKIGDTDGPAGTALFSLVFGVTEDPTSNGDLIIADYNNHVIRRVNAAGVVNTIAGSPGLSGYRDGTAKVAARFRFPTGVAVNSKGEIYITDRSNNCIRKLVGNQVSTFAGTCTKAGFRDGKGTAALFNAPAGIAVDGTGNLYVADLKNHRVRKITPSGAVTTLAGTGVPGKTNGPKSRATINTPFAIAVNSKGDVFVSGSNNHCIRKITPSGTVSTFAGVCGVSGWLDGPATQAKFKEPSGLTFGPQGVLYVADSKNNRIRAVGSSGTVSTFYGTGAYGRKFGNKKFATFKAPGAVVYHRKNKTLYVADTNNYILRRIFLP